MKFDINNAYTAINADTVKIGSRGYYADNLESLKIIVSDEVSGSYGVVTKISGEDNLYRFCIDNARSMALFYPIKEPEIKTEAKQLSLNEIAKLSYENAKKREENSGHISAETRAMLKHCATEVVEATEAYSRLNFEKLVFSAENENKFASELADIICCCTIIAGRENIDLDKAVADCLEKNRKRAEGTGDKL